jgi:hypothetical protein
MMKVTVATVDDLAKFATGGVTLAIGSVEA